LDSPTTLVSLERDNSWRTAVNYMVGLSIQYWAQCQVYMNMVDTEIAHYVEYHVDKDSPVDGSKGEIFYVPVIRDRTWWKQTMPKIERFYEEMNKWIAKGSLDEHPLF
jgi:hypothetical protein